MAGRDQTPRDQGFKTYMRAGVLVGLAEDAYHRTKEGPSDRAPGQCDALVAILLSATALEAFINEVGGLARILAVEAPSLRMLGKLLQEMEDAWQTVYLKFLLARAILAGQLYDKGAQPYQDFDLLIKLRNDIVHLQFEKVDLDARKLPPRLLGLRSRNVLAEWPENVAEKPKTETGNIETTWVAHICTQATARWACNTAAAMVHSLLEVLPSRAFKRILDDAYNDVFVPVE